MELGARIRKARLEAGLSQRQLCADVITRNMLSQIENGSAKPSMQTLRHLAATLQKPISFFLEEEVVVSSNQQTMALARQAYACAQPTKVLSILSNYQEPDPVFDQEMHLIRALSLIEAAQQALADQKAAYCINLLEQAKISGEATAYYTPELEQKRLLLLAQAAPEQLNSIVASLQDNTTELLVRACAASTAQRRLQLLDAVNDTENLYWHLLRGETWMQLQRYDQALPHLEKAMEKYPSQTLPLLEQCCRELEDYKMAYYYACLQRKP